MAVAETEPFGFARSEVFEKNIRGRREPPQNAPLILTPVIEHDAFLVAIHTQEDRALAIDKGGAYLARIIAFGRFDLNYFGPGIGKLHRTEWTANPFG